MVVGKACTNAEGYSKRHLSRNDYYEKGRQVHGVWIGQTCERFGVEQGATVQDKQFESLRQNQNAATGEQITLRQNTTRKEWVVDKESGKLVQVEVANRREFYDFVCSAPKTFSALAVTAGDERVRQWHDRAVRKMMAEMERITSIRNPSQDGDATARTGQFCAAWYKHDANRCLEPQLHDHIVVFNMTPQDEKAYAVEARTWMDRSRYLTAIYRDALAQEAIAAGYGISIDRWGAPQIQGLEDLIEVYSQRTRAIETLVERVEELAGTKLAIDEVKDLVLASRGLNTDRFDRLWKENRDHFEALKKLHTKEAEADLLRRRLLNDFKSLVKDCCDKGHAKTTTEAVRASQLAVLNDEQRSRLFAFKHAPPTQRTERQTRCIEESLEHAMLHSFERKSVLKDYEFLTAAIEFGLGENVDLVELRKAAGALPGLIRGRGAEVTTTEHLERELDLIRWVEEGKGKGISLTGQEIPEKLSPFQRQAVQDLLESKDQLTVLVGRAGTGKTVSLKSVVDANLKSGHAVHTMAPSNAARDVLRGEGGKTLERSESLQMFLASPSLKSAVQPNDLLILDEAGYASTEDLHRLIAFARERQARLLMVGDPRQHNSVAAGDALHILLKRTEVKRAALFEIVRQQPNALDGLYLKAAKLFSQGQTTAAFAALDESNVIVEHKGVSRVQALADAIMQEHARGRSVIAVNPSHRENDAVNAEVRARRKALGELGEERVIPSYRSLGWTYAERRDVKRIKPGQILEVTQGQGKGHAWVVERNEKGKVTARNAAGEEREFTKSHAKSFDVCEPQELAVAVGDKLITRAGVRSPRGEVINGERITVSGFDAQGNVLSDQGKLITTKNLSHAYAMTSHRSQGDTADTVLFGMDRHSIRWADQKLAYVAATRGRTEIKVFVEQKADLTGIQTRPGDRKAATDLEPTAQVIATTPEHTVNLLHELKRLQRQETIAYEH